MGRSSANLVIFERRVLMGVTVFTLIGTVIWIIAVSTDYWYFVDAPQGILNNETGTYFYRSHSGLWRICRTEFKNTSNREAPALLTTCTYYPLFPSRSEVDKNPEIDHTILDYVRTETAFSIISFGLMVMAHGFSFYTFKVPRYTFKRLAGGIHFLTAATIVVVVEVTTNSVHYSETYLPARHPKGAKWYYGFSYILAWISFVSFVIAGLAFIICSRKRKGDKSGNDLHGLDDEPHILGR